MEGTYTLDCIPSDTFRCYSNFESSERDVLGIPFISTQYRVANVVNDLITPVVRLRLLSTLPSVCNELQISLALVEGDYIYVTVNGVDYFSKTKLSLGDFIIQSDYLDDVEVVSYSINKITGVRMSIVESQEVLDSYFLHVDDSSSKLSSLLSDSFIRNLY